MDVADLLNNVVNLKRTQVAQGFVINNVRSSNMERLIWDESLSITAQNISARCNLTYTNISELGALYQRTLSLFGTNAHVTVSNNSQNILVGETMHIVEDWQNANDAALQSFNAWQDECDLFNIFVGCNGSTSDPSACRNCLQLIWAKSRYVGCALSGCPVIRSDHEGRADVFNSVLFVCHWYWGADLFEFNGNTNWRIPFNPGQFCQEMPFDIAGCNDTERNECNNALCDGCPR